MTITTVGIDLAKSVFRMHGGDEHGKAVFRRTVSRGKVMEVMAGLVRSFDDESQPQPGGDI